MKYKIYFDDRSLRSIYPVTIYHKDINELCKWINIYIKRWNIKLLRAEILDWSGNRIGDVSFIPSEIINQKCITTYEERLLAYSKFYDF